jgi:HEAT repeat protein
MYQRDCINSHEGLILSFFRSSSSLHKIIICHDTIHNFYTQKCMTEEDYPLVIECAEHMLENDKEDGIIRIKALVCVLSIPKEHQPGFINKYIYKLLSDGTDQEKIWVCRQVIYAFERSLDEQTTNKLCELLHAESRFVRQAAALALKHTPKAETISNLLDVLQNDHDDFVRDTVATTLNSIAHS